MVRALRFALALSVCLGVLLVASIARADKVAVLALSGPSPEKDAARKAARDAAVQRGFTLPTDAETAAAERAVTDGVPDNSIEYRAAGRASGSQWTVAGKVELGKADVGEEPLWRVELEACLVESGRVESLARDVDPADATAQIAEMLALMLRAEGIGPELPPWHGKKPVPKPKPPAPKPPEPPKPPAPPPPPKAPEPPPPAYAAKAPFAVGLAGGVLVAAVRPDSASGAATSGVIGGYAGYAFEQVPGLEARLEIEGAVAGPRALAIDAGARYAFPIAPRLRIYAGPEVALGTFVTLGAEQKARLLGRGAARSRRSWDRHCRARYPRNSRRRCIRNCKSARRAHPAAAACCSVRNSV